MGAFTYTFDPSKPAGSDLANTLDTVIQNALQSMKERLTLEHNALDSAAAGATDSDNATAQGRHIPGKVACVYIGTTADITALTGMVSGSAALDTDLGILKIYNGTNWTTRSVGNGVAFAAVPATNQGITVDTWTRVVLGTETFDYGSYFATPTYTPLVAGLYQFNFGVYITNSVAGLIYSGLYKNGSLVAAGSSLIGSSKYGQSNGSFLVSANGTTDYFELYAYNSASTATIVASRTYFNGFLVTRV